MAQYSVLPALAQLHNCSIVQYSVLPGVFRNYSIVQYPCCQEPSINALVAQCSVLPGGA